MVTHQQDLLDLTYKDATNIITAHIEIKVYFTTGCKDCGKTVAYKRNS